MIREKGIEEALAAVARVNGTYGRMVYTLDIYGQVGEGYADRFAEALREAGDFATYRGTVDPEESVGVLKDYYALLFPTYYEGEGLAGTLIDAMCAGLPVVASDWGYNRELVSEETGRIVKARDVASLAEALAEIYEGNAGWLRKKASCLRAAERYRPEIVLTNMIQKLQCMYS